MRNPGSRGLAGLSQLALRYAGEGAGTFGAGVNAALVWQKLEAGVADGCWDGAAGAVPLSIGEVTLDDQSARRALAEAIGAWIEGAENPTMIRDQLDLLPLLDDITSSGPTGDLTPATTRRTRSSNAASADTSVLYAQTEVHRAIRVAADG